MELPLPAEGFGERYSTLIGEDTLYDQIDAVARVMPAQDVRPLIASRLELWARWVAQSTLPNRWEDGVRERAMFLVERFGDFDRVSLVPHKENVRDDEEAVALHIAIKYQRNEGEAVKYKVRKIMPGIYAVHVPRTGDLYRVECIYGLVNGCGARDFTEEVRASLFDEAPAPSFN